MASHKVSSYRELSDRATQGAARMSPRSGSTALRMLQVQATDETEAPIACSAHTQKPSLSGVKNK